jgi:hypothetical protein
VNGCMGRVYERSLSKLGYSGVSSRVR